MEPTAPNPQPSYSSQPSPEVPGSHLTKKKLMILAGAALMIVIAIVLYLALGGDKKPDATTSDKTAANSSSSGISVKLTPKDGAQKLAGGTTILPACSIITMDDLAKQNLSLYKNGYGYPVMQSYLDKSGEAPFQPYGYSYPASEDTLHCVYGIGDGHSSVTVTVTQPFIVTAAVANDNLNLLHMAKQPDEDGYQVYMVKKDDQADYIFRKDGNDIRLQFEKLDQSKTDNLIKAALANLRNLDSKPKGPSVISYDKSAYNQDFVQACSLVDNADMKGLSGNDASPLVKQYAPSTTGDADFSQVSNYKTKTKYLRSMCTRSANKPENKELIGGYAHTLQVVATSYQSDQAAMQGLVHLSVGDGNDSKISGKGVGQEAYLYKTQKDHQNALAFRQGRVVIELVYDFAFQDGDPSTSDLNAYGQKLSPVGEKIAAQLKNFK